MTFALADHDGATWIAAEGTISANTANEFTDFVAGLDNVPDTIVLNSNGGRLSGGLALGRAIRAAGLATRVGDTVDCPTRTAVREGLCASSCAYAFIGGVNRMLGDTGHIGFHGIYPAAGQGSIAEDVLASAEAQTMETLRRYLEEMGADPRLADLADRIDADDLFLPRGPILTVLGIETGPIEMAADETGLPTQL